MWIRARKPRATLREDRWFNENMTFIETKLIFLWPWTFTFLDSKGKGIGRASIVFFFFPEALLFYLVKPKTGCGCCRHGCCCCCCCCCWWWWCFPCCAHVFFCQEIFSIRWGQFPGMLTSVGVGHIRRRAPSGQRFAMGKLVSPEFGASSMGQRKIGCTWGEFAWMWYNKLDVYEWRLCFVCYSNFYFDIFCWNMFDS